ncbi:tetratricopeptide repeat protein (plasmid) [Streptomyces sp. NBC_01520]|uniref:tetratricopeptide repeat protein n=1 Tax=Streptomyces sp. NBC_01520 TaxID=2903892 RepID=UPI002F907769
MNIYAAGTGVAAQHIEQVVLPSHVPEWPMMLGPLPARAHAFQERRQSGELTELAGAEGGGCVVLSGAAGVGKTQLATDFAHRVWDGRQADLVVWCDAGSRLDVVTRYANAAFAITGLAEPEPEAAARRFLSWLHTTDRPWLVVLDNLADPADLRELWPPTRPGCVTVTTTRHRSAVLGEQGRELWPVDLYTRAEAVAYLSAVLSPRGSGTMSDFAGLAADLDRLPVALAQAAAYIVDNQLSCNEYRRRLRERLLSASMPGPDELRDGHHVITATWSMSVELANRSEPVGMAGPLLDLAACLDPGGIPLAVLTAPAVCDHLSQERARAAGLDCIGADAARIVTRDEVADALQVLRRLNLLDFADEATGGPHQQVRVHSLVQRVVCEQFTAEQADARFAVCLNAVDGVWGMFPQHLPEGARMRANAKHLLTVAGDALWHPQPSSLPLAIGFGLAEAGYQKAAAEFFGQHRAECELRFGHDDPRTLDVCLTEAQFLIDADDRIEARAKLTALLPRLTQVFSEDGPATLQACVLLAHLTGADGDAVGAVAEFEELSRRHEAALGASDWRTINVHMRTARWYGESGAHERAIALLEGTAADQAWLYGRRDVGALVTQRSIAYWYFRSGDPDQAAHLYDQVMRAMADALGSDHPQTIACARALFALHMERGNYAAALPALRMLEPVAALDGSSLPDVLRTRADLAMLRVWNGVPEAVDELATVRADAERILGSAASVAVTTDFYAVLGSVMNHVREVTQAPGFVPSEHVADPELAALGTTMDAVAARVSADFSDNSPRDVDFMRALGRMLRGEDSIAEAMHHIISLFGGTQKADASQALQVLQDLGKLGIERPPGADTAPPGGPDVGFGSVPGAMITMMLVSSCLKVSRPDAAADVLRRSLASAAAGGTDAAARLVDDCHDFLQKTAAADRTGAAAAIDVLVTCATEVLGALHRHVLNMRGDLYLWGAPQDTPTDAIPHFALLVQEMAEALGSDEPDTLNARTILASLRSQVGVPAEAAQELDDVVAAFTRALGPLDEKTRTARHAHAHALHLASRHSAAAAAFGALLVDTATVLGVEHESLGALDDWIAACAHQAYTDEGPLPAAALAAAAWAWPAQVWGPNAPRTQRLAGFAHEWTWEAGSAGDPLGAVNALTTLRDEIVRQGHEGGVAELSTRVRLADWRGCATRDFRPTVTEVAALAERLTEARGSDSPEALFARFILANARGGSGDPARAEREQRSLARERAHVLGTDHIDTLRARRSAARWLADSAHPGADPESACVELRDLLDAVVRRAGPMHAEVAATLAGARRCSDTLKTRGRPGDAARLSQDVLGDVIRLLGTDHPQSETAFNWTIHDLDAAAADLGPARGAQLYRGFTDRLSIALSRDHAWTLAAWTRTLWWRTVTTTEQTDVDKLTELAETASAGLGEQHPLTLNIRIRLAEVTGLLGDPVDAAARLGALHQSAAESLGEDDPVTARALHLHAQWVAATGDDVEALALADTYEQRHGSDDMETLAIRNMVLLRLAKSGAPRAVRRAAAEFERLVSRVETALGRGADLSLIVRHNHGFSLVQEGDTASAAAVLTLLLAEVRAVHGNSHARVSATVKNIRKCEGSGDPWTSLPPP